jgi:hypothetical protein
LSSEIVDWADETRRAEITHHQAQTIRTMIEAFGQISGDRIPVQALIEAVVKNDLTLIFNSPNQEGTNA